MQQWWLRCQQGWWWWPQNISCLFLLIFVTKLHSNQQNHQLHAKQKTFCPFPEVNNYLALKFNQNKDYCYHCIRINWISNSKVLFGGIGPICLLPYPFEGGILSFLFPPTCIPTIPRSHPLITSPAPSWKENGEPFKHASNCLLFFAKLPL